MTQTGPTTVTRLIHQPAPDGVVPGSGCTHVVSGTGRLVVLARRVALDERGGALALVAEDRP